MLLWPLLCALLLALSLGLAAFASAPARPENRAFAAFQWLAAVWVGNDLAFWCFPGPEDGQRWARTALLLALALQLTLLRFAWTFRAAGPPPRAATLLAVGAAGAAALPVLAGWCFGRVALREDAVAGSWPGSLDLELRPWGWAVGGVVYGLFAAGVGVLVGRRRREPDPLARRLIGRFLLAALFSATFTSLVGVALPLLGVSALLPALSLGILVGAAFHFHSLARLGFLRPPGPVEPGRGLPVTASLALAVALCALLGAGGALLAARLAVGPGADPEAWPRAAALGLLAASFPAMALVLLAQRVVTRPLAEITAAALRVSAGERGVRVPVPARGDEVALLAGALDDMIGRLERERDLERELQDKLRRTERLAIAGTLAAGVAHEVNNPLAAVSSLVQLVAERAPDPQARQQLLEALGQIDRISAALRELMDVARPGPRARARVDLAEVVERTARLVRFDRRFRRIALEVEAPPGALLQGDPDQLAQVLLNLLLNAADAQDGQPGRVRVRLVRRAGELVLRVEDDGPGIPPEARARLFEPFFTTKPAGAGTGLGLAVCRDLVREHGGRIEVASGDPGRDPGSGTVVEVTLPAEVTA